MADGEDNIAALERDLVAAGLDPAGINLAWLAEIRIETEQTIACYRTTEGFGAADPAFNPPCKEQP